MHKSKCVCVFFFHEANNVESLHIFNKTKDLDNNNFSNLNEFQKVVVVNWRSKNFAPQFS